MGNRSDDHLDNLFEAAMNACEKGASAADFEDAFVNLLRYITCHPGSRAKAENLFIGALDFKVTPWEVIAFCMHELRWDRIRREIESRARKATDPRSQRVLGLMRESFEDRWDQREMYSYYTSRA